MRPHIGVFSAGEQGCDETESIPVAQNFHVAYRQVVISNALWLSLRAADKFVRSAQAFQSAVKVCSNGIIANGRSILDLISLAAECGTTLAVEAQGCDAEDAVAALANLISAQSVESDDQMLKAASLSQRSSQTQSPKREGRSNESKVSQTSDRSWNCGSRLDLYRRQSTIRLGMDRRTSIRGRCIRGGSHGRQ
jgi:phosphocarrier protein HPr